MSPPTYLQRVQKVLSDLAKEQVLAIDYGRFLRKVRSRILRSSVSVTSAFRAGVRAALIAEARNGRITVVTIQAPPAIRVHFTPAGYAFFQTLALPPRTRRRHSLPPNLKPSPKVEVAMEYRSLVTILHSIQTLFAQNTFATAECYSIAKLPKMVRCYLELEHDLRQENLTLSFHANELNWELMQMQAALPQEDGVED